jgi:hypothetical protein
LENGKRQIFLFCDLYIKPLRLHDI